MPGEHSESVAAKARRGLALWHPRFSKTSRHFCCKRRLCRSPAPSLHDCAAVTAMAGRSACTLRSMTRVALAPSVARLRCRGVSTCRAAVLAGRGTRRGAGSRAKNEWVRRQQSDPFVKQVRGLLVVARCGGAVAWWPPGPPLSQRAAVLHGDRRTSKGCGRAPASSCSK